jgi:hypothetical protein
VNYPRFLYWLIVLSVWVSSCRNTQIDSTVSSNRALASVYGKMLYLSEMRELLPEGATHDDSTLIINAYVDRWIREQLTMHEAERNIPRDLNLDSLLNAYRASLILNAYETHLIETNLDSVISDTELKAFYEANKAQYQLDMPIVRCYFLKIPKPVEQTDSLQKWWNNPQSGENKRKLLDYAAKYRLKTFLLEDSSWYKTEQIAAFLPPATLTTENVENNKELTLKDDKFQYFYRAFAVMSKKQIAPFGFIKEQATKLILHQRKIKLLEQKKKERYDVEMRKNNVKIF